MSNNTVNIQVGVQMSHDELLLVGALLWQLLLPNDFEAIVKHAARTSAVAQTVGDEAIRALVRQIAAQHDLICTEHTNDN